MAEVSDTALRHPGRLAAVRASGLMDSAADPQFDRYTRLVRAALGAPIALICVVDDERQFFKSEVGLDGALALSRQTPLRYCLCHYAIATRRPFVVNDALSNARVCNNLAVIELGVRAYLGVPLRFMGQVIGTLVAIDLQPRVWSNNDIDILTELCALVARELRHRDVEAEVASMAAAAQDRAQQLDTLLQTMDEAVELVDATGSTRLQNSTARSWANDAAAGAWEKARKQPLALALSGERVLGLNLRVAHADGYLWRNVNVSALRDAANRITGALLVARDITTEKRALDAAERSAHELSDLYNNAPCGYHSLGLDGTFLKINDTLLGWLQREREEVVGKLTLADLAVARPNAHEDFKRLREVGYVSDVEFELRRRDGSTFPVLLNAGVVRDDNGEFLMSRATLVDFTQFKQTERQLQQLVRTDPLTRLLNRRGLFERIDALREQARASRRPWRLLLADIDGLKRTNDSRGHQAGDELIIATAELLRELLGEDALIARIGGDEFVAALLLPSIDEPLPWLPGSARFSVGEITLSPDDNRPFDQLLSLVDALMYRHKTAPRREPNT